MNYIGILVVDNRTTDTVVTIGVPSILKNSAVNNALFRWSDPHPFVVPAVSGEQRIGYSFDVGVFYDATEDYIRMPVTIEKKDKPISNGTINIFTTDGRTNPSFVIFQLIIGNNKIEKTIEINDLNSFFSLNHVDLGRINITFTDYGDITNVKASSDNFFIDKAVDIMITLATL